MKKIKHIIIKLLFNYWCLCSEQRRGQKAANLRKLCPCCNTHTHTRLHSVLACLWMLCVSGRQRGLSASHWPRAYQFAVISLAWLSSVHCQLSKGLLWACPLMRGCSHALESIQHSNRSRMAAQRLPIALDWRMSGGGSGEILRKERYAGKDRYVSHIFYHQQQLLLATARKEGSNWLATNLPLRVKASDSAAEMSKF